MTIKLRNALFLCAMVATLVAFASAQYLYPSNADVTNEEVGGGLRGIVSGVSRFGNRYSTPIENGAKLFNQGRSGSELNKFVNHAAKKQWSWAPSSKPNPNTDWGARSSRAIKRFFNKDVMENTDESGVDDFPIFDNEDDTEETEYW